MEKEWQDRLGPEAYHVMREGGTEPPFSGEYVDCKEEGTYVCKGCGQPLFRSEDKFDSGTGWPSYTKPIKESVKLKGDASHGMERVEVSCSGCGSHLGHVFDGGPSPSGKRFCINSVCLRLRSS